MVGGLSAAAFGVLFGSVFSLHGLVPALWLQPLDAPLTRAAGAAGRRRGAADPGPGPERARSVLARRDGGCWLLTDAALIVVYLGLLAAFVAPGGAAGGRRRRAVLLHRAHACTRGRAAAAFARRRRADREDAADPRQHAVVRARRRVRARPRRPVVGHRRADGRVPTASSRRRWCWSLGNALVIVLEALVVSIQTTRLVLFEFFTRFMQGQGRAFRPLPAPPSIHQENYDEKTAGRCRSR